MTKMKVFIAATALLGATALTPAIAIGGEVRGGFVILPDTDLTGVDYVDRRPVSLEGCQTLCFSDGNCAGYSYVPAKRWCWLKSSVAASSPANGIISGRRATQEEKLKTFLKLEGE